MPETPKETPGVEEGSAGTESQPQESSQEFVSRTERNAAVDTIIAEMKAQAKANRQSQADVITNRVRKEVGNKLADALRPNLPLEPAVVPDAPSQALEPALPSAVSGVELEIQTILSTHGLTGEEPELIAYATENKGKPWYQVGAGFAAVAEKISTRAGGSILAGEGTGTASPNDVQAYINKVMELRKAATAGTDRNTLRSSLRTLKEEYRKKGVEVDKIGFGSRGTRSGT
mgnify:CR=1 FL=1